MQVQAGYPADIAANGTQAGRFSLELHELLEHWSAGDKDLFLFQSDHAENSGNCKTLHCVLDPPNSTAKDGAVEFSVPASLKPMDSLIASIGPSEQGLPLHSHGAAWQALVHGKKFWVLLPPMAAKGLDGSSVTTLLELSKKKSLGRAFFCLQEPGEVVVVPHLWRHATMNIGDAIAIGGQVRGEMLTSMLQCLEPLIRGQKVKSYEEGFGICE